MVAVVFVRGGEQRGAIRQPSARHFLMRVCFKFSTCVARATAANREILRENLFCLRSSRHAVCTAVVKDGGASWVRRSWPTASASVWKTDGGPVSQGQ